MQLVLKLIKLIVAAGYFYVNVQLNSLPLSFVDVKFQNKFIKCKKLNKLILTLRTCHAELDSASQKC